MSAAEALARLRADKVRRPKPLVTPSLLHDKPSDAAKVSRAEMAGLALNGLESLATIDQALPALHAPLLLLSPAEDRTTLAPQRAEALADAVVALATRISPAFPLRHAQKALEWLIRGLHLPTLGTDPEIDAVLLGALPFHATPAFARLVNALLYRTPDRALWKWLRPVAKQRKPAALSYIVSNAPIALLRAAIRFSVSTVKLGVSAVAFSSFLANILGRRLADMSVPDTERRQLVLHVLDAVDMVRKEKGPSRRKVRADVLCALFSCVASAVSVGIDSDVAEAAARTVSSALLKLDRKSPASDTALACLALLVTRGGIDRLPEGSAKSLLSSGTAAALIPRIGDVNLMQQTYRACILGLLSDFGVHVGHVKVLCEAFSTSSSEMLSDASVSAVLTRLLDILSLPERAENASGKEDRGDLEERLVHLVSLIARGRYAEGVDDALSNHLGKRKRAKLGNDRYDFVDRILEAALSGTSFEILKVEAGKEQAELPSGDTMLGMLSHPLPAVRRVTLEKLASNRVMQDQLDDHSKGKIVDQLLDACRHDQDHVSAALAVQCVLQFPKQCDSWEILPRIVDRIRLDFLVPSKQRKKKRKSRSAARRAFAACLVEACEQCEERHMLSVQAMWTGLLFSGFLGDEEGLTDLQSRVRGLLRRPNSGLPWHSALKEHGTSSLLDEVKHALVTMVEDGSWDCAPFNRALSSWDVTWSVGVLDLMVSHLSNVDSPQQKPISIDAVLRSLTSLHSEVRDQDSQERLKTLAVRALKPICATVGKGVSFRSAMDAVWNLVAGDGPLGLVGQLVGQIIELTSLNEALDMMQRSIAERDDSRKLVAMSSLRWYITISQFIDSREAQRAAVTTVLSSLYASDLAMRSEAIAYCGSKHAITQSKKTKGKMTELLQLSALIRNSRGSSAHLLETSREHPREVEEVLSLISTFRSRDGYGMPVVSLTGDFLFILDIIADLETTMHRRLCLLRAISFSDDIPLEYGRRLFELLQCLLKMVLTSTPDCMAVIEALARVQALIYHLGSGVQPAREVVLDIFEGLLPRFRELQEPSKPQEGIAWELWLVLVCSATQVASVMRSFEGLESECLELHGFLLTFSLQSSPAGRHARRYFDRFSAEKLVPILKPFLSYLSNGLEPQSKKKRDGREAHDLSRLDFVMKESCFGAVECVRRLSSLTIPNTSTLPILGALWGFVSRAMAPSRDGTALLNDDVAYKLESVLNALHGLYKNSLKGELLSPVDISALIAAMFYRCALSEETESPLITIVRQASLRLFEVLAPTNPKPWLTAAVPEVDKLIGNEEGESVLRYLCTIVPILAKLDCSFETMCGWMVRAIYRGKQKSLASGEDRRLVADTIRQLGDLPTSTSAYVEAVVKHTAQFLAPELIAKECSLFLLEVEQGVVADLTVISSLKGEILGELARFHILHPDFVMQLVTTLGEVELCADNPVAKAFSKLFLALLVVDPDSTAHDAIGAVLATLPLSSLSTCIEQALSNDAVDVQLRCLETLLDRLDADDVPLCHNFNFIGESIRHDASKQRAAEASFVETVGSLLCKLVKEEAGKRAKLKIVQCAMSCFEKLCKRLGSSSHASLVNFANVFLDIVQDERSPTAVCNARPLDPCCAQTGSSLLCLARIIAVLGKHAVPFIPTALDASVSVLKSSFDVGAASRENVARKAVATWIAVAEGAVKTCTTVLETCPKFFGMVTLRTIMSLTVSSGAEVLKDLVIHAARVIPSSVFVAAMTGVSNKLEELRSTASGLSTFLNILTIGVQGMRKSELKLETSRVLSIIIKCLEASRNSKKMSLISSSGTQEVIKASTESGVNESRRQGVGETDDFLLACRTVDESSAVALTTLTLRLSESEFREVFRVLMRWQDDGTLPPEACGSEEEGDARDHQSLLRTVPFYRICLHLFQKLQTIFSPFFLHVLDRVIDIISRENVFHTMGEGQETERKSTLKKRKRSSMERDDRRDVAEKLAGLEIELRDICLDNLTLFLRQESEGEGLTRAAVGKIQCGLLSGFDLQCGKSERVRGAFDALGARIVSNGSVSESKEESRELLMSLSREVLLRTRSRDASARAGALLCCKSVASAVGEEFLVTLPEAMPVLSEVIDDEDVSVQRAVVSFVKVMEDLSGESILSELR